jgi:hypothetical protein
MTESPAATCASHLQGDAKELLATKKTAAKANVPRGGVSPPVELRLLRSYTSTAAQTFTQHHWATPLNLRITTIRSDRLLSNFAVATWRMASPYGCDRREQAPEPAST